MKRGGVPLVYPVAALEKPRSARSGPNNLREPIITTLAHKLARIMYHLVCCPSAGLSDYPPPV